MIDVTQNENRSVSYFETFDNDSYAFKVSVGKVYGKLYENQDFLLSWCEAILLRKSVWR